MYKENLDKLANLSRKYDPFYEEQTWEKYFEECFNELKEALEGYNQQEQDELEKELADVYFDFMCLIEKLDQENNINKDKVFQKWYEKFSKRKSFILEERKVTKDEAKEIWNKAKKNEWYQEDRLWN